jgi:Tfp pilus assembly protein PilN
MGEIDELRRHLDALEAQVHEVTEQQAATRHLAVNADHGVAALQDHRRTDVQLLQALRTTQLDHGKILEEHSRLLGVLVSGQVAIMEHLGMNPPETAADGG